LYAEDRDKSFQKVTFAVEKYQASKKLKPQKRVNLHCIEKTCNFDPFCELLLVFPIRVTILKPGFRVVEKKKEKLVFSGFEMNEILSDKNSMSL